MSMAHLQAVSQALTRAVQSLPNVADAVRVLVLPLVVPPKGRCVGVAWGVCRVPLVCRAWEPLAVTAA